jgi:hypothetical protein
MNVEIGTEAAQFLFWEYLFKIFAIGSLQCGIPVKKELWDSALCELVTQLESQGPGVRVDLQHRRNIMCVKGERSQKVI